MEMPPEACSRSRNGTVNWQTGQVTLKNTSSTRPAGGQFGKRDFPALQAREAEGGSPRTGVEKGALPPGGHHSILAVSLSDSPDCREACPTC